MSILKTINVIPRNTHKTCSRWYNASSRRKTKRYARQLIRDFARFNGVPEPRVLFRQRLSFLSRLTKGGTYNPPDPELNACNTTGMLFYWRPGRIDEEVVFHEVYHHLQHFIDHATPNDQTEKDAREFAAFMKKRRYLQKHDLR